MILKDRKQAGEMLAQKLLKLKGQDLAIYALPRGGVVVAYEIAKNLNAPLDLILTRKIGHPYNPEYAIAAVSESGEIIKNESEVKSVDSDWFKNEVERQKDEMKRRRKTYLGNDRTISPKGEIAIIVDDGLATGLTMRAAISQIKTHSPKKVIVAVPVAPEDTAHKIEEEIDELISLQIDDNFLGAIGAYYENFDQVSDQEVMNLLEKTRERQND